MKTPLYLISTDWHLEKKNTLQILDLVDQIIKVAKELKINKLILLGDLFTSRKAQEEEVLITLGSIFQKLFENNITSIVIPGNHDKVDGNSQTSFLSEFKYHPGVTLVEDLLEIEFKKSRLIFLPFFNDELFVQKLSIINEQHLEDTIISNYLFTHQSVHGTQNNEKSVVLNSLKTSLFTSFSKVFLGHIHDRSVTGKFTYVGSICQNNFGESNQKGVTVLYDDFSDELIKLNFKEFRTIEIDTDTLSVKELDKITKESSESEDRVRFEFKGSEEKINSLNLDKIKSSGISISKKSNPLEVSLMEDSDSVEVNSMSSDDIINHFYAFLNKEGIGDDDSLIGRELLGELLNEDLVSTEILLN